LRSRGGGGGRSEEKEGERRSDGLVGGRAGDSAALSAGEMAGQEYRAPVEGACSGRRRRERLLETIAGSRLDAPLPLVSLASPGSQTWTTRSQRRLDPLSGLEKAAPVLWTLRWHCSLARRLLPTRDLVLANLKPRSSWSPALPTGRSHLDRS